MNPSAVIEKLSVAHFYGREPHPIAIKLRTFFLSLTIFRAFLNLCRYIYQRRHPILSFQQLQDQERLFDLLQAFEEN
jgi:hypothetical protein